MTLAPADDHRYSAEIRRTEYGIPHIVANDYGSLGYGYGYAFAQDNLCVMADRVVTLRGDRSRYFGPRANAGDPFADEEDATSNLASDVYYRGVRQSGVVRRLLARPAPLGPTAQLRRMVDGYVAGYNRYLRDTGVAHLPDPTCRGKAWVGPITALDVWSGIYDLNTLQGTGQFREAIVSARPAAGAPAPRPAPTIPAAQPARTGSNGWALGRDATRDHDGMLLANPHWPWAGHARYYQVQLTIPGVLDVAGASVSGTPVVEIGHTQGVAWTHTTSTARRFTLFQLDLAPGKPTSYLVDGRTEPMTRQKVTVTVRGVRRRAVDREADRVPLTVWAGAGHRLDGQDRVRPSRCQRRQPAIDERMAGDGQLTEHRSAPRRARELPGQPLHQHDRRRCRRDGVLRRRVGRPPRHRRESETLHRQRPGQGPLPRDLRPGRLEVRVQLGQRPRRRSSAASSRRAASRG